MTWKICCNARLAAERIYNVHVAWPRKCLPSNLCWKLVLFSSWRILILSGLNGIFILGNKKLVHTYKENIWKGSRNNLFERRCSILSVNDQWRICWLIPTNVVNKWRWWKSGSMAEMINQMHDFGITNISTVTSPRSDNSCRKIKI